MNSELHSWIQQVLEPTGLTFEILFIDDGSTDSSWDVISTLSRKHNSTKAIRFLTNYGKSQALHAGFKRVEGDVVITMDADLQDSPEEITELYEMITTQQYDLVSGWKRKRYDNVMTKNFIPVLATNAGFSKIGEKEVQHQARKYGTTKFGYERFILPHVQRFKLRPRNG